MLERGAANIGFAEGWVKQKIVSTSQIVSKQMVRIFLHAHPHFAVLISVNDMCNHLQHSDLHYRT
jgi:hypothetical protein